MGWGLGVLKKNGTSLLMNKSEADLCPRDYCAADSSRCSTPATLASDPATCPIIPGCETTIEICKGRTGLGLSIVGGCDTLLVNTLNDVFKIIFHHQFLIYSLQLKKLELKENPVVVVIN